MGFNLKEFLNLNNKDKQQRAEPPRPASTASPNFQQQANKQNYDRYKSGQITKPQYEDNLSNILNTKGNRTSITEERAKGQLLQDQYRRGQITKGGFANQFGDTVRQYNPDTRSNIDVGMEKLANKASNNFVARNVITGAAQLNPTKLVGNVAGYVGRGAQALGWDDGKYLAQSGDQMARLTQVDPQGEFRSRGFADDLVRGGIELAGDIVNPVSRIAAPIKYGTTSANDLAREMEATGNYTPQQSFGAGTILGVTSGLLEKTGIDKIAGNAVGNTLRKVTTRLVTSGLTEGVTEGAQTLAENTARNLTVNPEQGFFENVPKSIAAGAILGTGARGGVEAGARYGGPDGRQNFKNDTQAVKDKYNKATVLPNDVNLSDNMLQTLGDFGSYKLGEYRPDAKTTGDLFRQSRAVAKAAGIDINSGSPVDINNRIGKFIEDYKARENAPKQGGFIGKGEPDSAPQVGKTTPNNQRTIDSYSTPKPVTEYKVGERVSNATAQGGTVDGTIVKAPDFSKDLRLKGNDFEIKLDDGTTIKTNGAGFDTPVAQVGKTDPIVNTKTGETLSQTVDKLKSQGWSQKDINAYKEAVLKPAKTEALKKANVGKLNDLNPTKGIYVDYTPNQRATIPLGDNMTTIDKTLGGSADDMVTVYRGTDKSFKQSEIQPGDFVTTLPELAKSYSGDGNVISKKVRKGDLLDDKSPNNYTNGEETIYRPNADKELSSISQSVNNTPDFGKVIAPKVKPSNLPKELPTKATATKSASQVNQPPVEKQVVPSTKKPKELLSSDVSNTNPVQKSRFASKTVQSSREVSQAVKKEVKSAEPTFQTVTDKTRIETSEKYIKKQGIKKATVDIKERLASKNLDDQTVSDAISVAKALDASASTEGLLESSAIYEQLATKLSKAGQTVQAASLLNNRTPEGLQYGALRAMKKAGIDATVEQKKEIGKLIDVVRKAKSGTYEDGLARYKVQEYIQKQIPASKSGKLVQLWKAGLLTSPRTTAGNLAANTFEAVFRKGYVDPVSTALDKITSMFTGKRSRSYTGRGMVTGAGEGIQKGISYFKTGYDPRNPAQKFDTKNIHYSDSKAGKVAEAYTQGVFRLMGSQDQPFYYAALRNSLYDQAITEAKNKGLKGVDRDSFIKKFVTEPDTKTMQLADKEARYAVFQDETALGKAASRIKSMDGATGTVAEFIIPFSGVPSSIATRMITRTPLGTATEIVRQIKSGKFNQRAMTKAIAEGSAIIPLVGVGYALAQAGMMTLGYPEDKKEKELWEADGRQPYSVKVGGTWLSTNYFQPAGNLLAAGAEYAGQIKKGENPSKALSTSVGGAMQSLTEQSFLQGVSGTLNAIKEPERYASRFVEQTAGSVVPNFIRTGARASDPFARETDGVVDSVKAGIPGLRQTLDVKNNMFGEAVERRSSPLNEVINPFKPSDSKNIDDKVLQETRRLQNAGEGIIPTQATKSSFGDLDTKQLRDINKEVGSSVKTEWNRILNDSRYTSLTDGDKKKLLDRANDAVYQAIKSKEVPDTKITKRAESWLKGEKVDWFEDFEASTQTVKSSTKKSTTANKTGKKSSGKKSSSKSAKAKKGTFDYSKRLSASVVSQSALRDIINKTTIKRKVIKA